MDYVLELLKNNWQAVVFTWIAGGIAAFALWSVKRVKSTLTTIKDAFIQLNTIQKSIADCVTVEQTVAQRNSALQTQMLSIESLRDMRYSMLIDALSAFIQFFCMLAILIVGIFAKVSSISFYAVGATTFALGVYWIYLTIRHHFLDLKIRSYSAALATASLKQHEMNLSRKRKP